MPRRFDTRELLVRAGQRVRAGWSSVALAAVAAAIAWYLAHHVLGHRQPFFAPIAAAISISTSRIQRSRRIAQMVAGVLLGIGIGELLVAALGTATAALGLIVLVTMTAALLSGEGFFGEGMMFANQAAASAILVVTVHHQGTGSERAVDALVGGGVAFILGVGLFPAQPMRLLHNAEAAVLRSLANTLEALLGFSRHGSAPEEGWAMSRGYEMHQLLGALARARATARANVRVAPRRWHLRAAVDAENRRTAQLDLLANAVLGLVRTGAFELRNSAASSGHAHLPALLEPEIAALGSAIASLTAAPPPWPDRVVREVLASAKRSSERAAAHGADRETLLASLVDTVAGDLERVVELGPEIAALRRP